MSTTRINELPAAASVNSGDFLAIDNTSGVSQKITAEQLLNVDPTLSVAGRPADAKATGDAIKAEQMAREQAVSEEAAARKAVGAEVDDLKSAIEAEATAREAADNELKSTLNDVNEWFADETGVHHYIFNIGAWIPTTTTTVDPTNIVANAAKAYCVIDCQPGDTFAFVGSGVNSAHRPWSFIDANGVVKSQATSNIVDATITAPAGAVRLVLNVDISNPYSCVKDNSRLTALENGLDETTETFTDWINKIANIGVDTEAETVNEHVFVNPTTGEIKSTPANYASTGKIKIPAGCGRIEFPNVDFHDNENVGWATYSSDSGSSVETFVRGGATKYIDVQDGDVAFAVCTYYSDTSPATIECLFHYNAVADRLDAKIDIIMPVTPQLYGAVGDGVTDDTAAFQAAINSGYSVYIPTAHKEVYKITSTLNVPNSCKRIFGDVVPSGHYYDGYILFDITGSLGTISEPQNYPLFRFAYNAQAISIAGLYVTSKDNNGSKLGTFLDATKITSGGTSMVDKDIALENIIVTNFYRIAFVAGRGFNAVNCSFASLARIAEFEWLKAGDEDTNKNYPPDYNQRGISFKNCRLHSISNNMITIVSGHVYGFEMIGCVADLGSGKIITANNEAWNWNISGNVFQGLVSGPSLHFKEGMKNCTISNNIFSADTTMKSTQSTPVNFMLTGGAVGCTISGNTFREPSEYHIVIGGTTISGLSISGNAFDKTPEGYNPVRFNQSATNVSFAGNTDTSARPIYSVASGKTVDIYSNSI